jgi:cytochrome bd-type quinol oxidase subunit 1
MLRSIGSVAAGYIVFAASAALLFQLSGREPHDPAPLAFMLASIIWGCTFALVAGWLTARVAGRQPMRHAAVLAAIIALGAIVSLIMSSGESWSQIAAAALMAPSAWLGGRLSRRA